MEIAFIIDGVYYSPKVAYDEEFAVYSPGHLLVRWIISSSVKRGILQYDMLGPRARYKCIWASDIREHANCYIIRPSVTGKIYHHFLTRVAPTMRRVKYSIWGDPQAVDKP